MSDKLREATENLVAVCDDLEAKSTGGGHMSGYWLQRNRIDPIRAALATADAPPEVTEEMVEVRELFQEWLGATITFRNDELVSGVTKRTRRFLSMLTE